MDHIKPLGPGDHCWTNVQVLCRSCNRKKIGPDKRELKEWRG
jgi:5-methylcytosine-specific restriction endonuclease McrA